MARPSRTTKQVAEKYKGNLGYFRKPHAFRTLRLVCFILAVVGSIAAVFGFRYYSGNRLTYFSTGSLCANHARFANRCEVCHEDTQPDIAEALSTNYQAMKAKDESLFKKVLEQLDPENLRKESERIRKKMMENNSLAKLDQACSRCHDAQQLHQPQTAALALRPVSTHIALVHATSCSTCHREHLGPEKMKLPPPNNCATCHGDKEKLMADFKLIPTGGKPAPATGKISDELGDGVRRFFPPRKEPHEPLVFTGFSAGHPSFGYEEPGSRDTAKIFYGHQRHEQADVVLDGKKLTCTDCHKPGADGMYMQPVRYQDHCARCHSLQFDQELPELLIPHRDPEKVYDFLQSKASQYNNYFMAKNPGVTDFQPRQAFVFEHLSNLMRHYNGADRNLELAVFLTGDPPINDRLTTKSNTAQFLPSCKKCHEGVKETPEGSHKWVVPKTNMAERWLTRGPFTHAAHTHMSCIDCHVKALTSNKTTDILLPTQKSCTECHRPLDTAKAEQSDKPAHAAAEIVEQQKREGGIKSDCQSCHPKYHTSELNNEAVMAAGWLGAGGGGAAASKK